ncbi:LysR family transcriptional regulator [Azospirillum sp. YIM B02556]|uniref:LysR family transcriptional regulator n=1 Tax=Azospirillum endophyticum TaxID=2800326 RepID=A0ABS1F0G1_9PROT|nr:LysR family transcriptional regulator [Azospirillum endophyticum]MBK1836904.1 LysR family transcriptional regulator [Azospirillum endophyticum]
MNWDDLRVFLALADSGSLSATARMLGVDHSTVARRVAALEADLGVRLFDRLPRGYAPTAEGEEFAALARRVEDGVLAVERHARGQPGEPAGTVRLSAPPAFASHFLAPRLAGLRRILPKLVVELVGDARAVSLTRREADLALRLRRPEDDGLIARRIGAMGYGLYATPGYLAGRDEAGWEFIGYDDSLDHVPQQRWLRQLAGRRPFVFRANDLMSLRGAATAGIGIAAIPHFLGRSPDSGLIPVRPAALLQPPEPRELWLLVHGDLRRSARVRAVMDALVSIIAAERSLLED